MPRAVALNGPAAATSGGSTGGSVANPYTTIPHRPAARSELDIKWTYPVHAAEVAKTSGSTIAPVVQHALSPEEAFATISRDDHRPLLVLRECTTCTGTDDALLTRQADNEKTMLVSRWFHCVKLPPGVLEADHPFHALFADAAPAHLFVSRWDGSGRADLNGQQSRAELWGILEGRLAADYATPFEPSLKDLMALLGTMDAEDERIAALKKKLDDRIERDGPDSVKAVNLKKEIERSEGVRAELRERAERISKLELKASATATAAAGPTAPPPAAN